MSGRAVCGGWLLGLAATATALAQTSALTVRVARGGGASVWVGQPVDLEVIVVAGAARPVVTPPEPAGALLAPVSLTLRPIASSGIGSVESQINEYRFRYRVVARSAGTLVVPPFRVETGGKSGVSAPQRWEVRPVPAAGRPAAWLGGVGRVTVAAEARPAALRVGQSFEWVVTLTGPGALGSVGPIDLARIEALAIAPEIHPLEDELSLEPPRRVRRWDVRPTKPGETRLPPPVVAWFDAATGTYQTAAGGGAAVRVVAAPRLDWAVYEAVGERERPGGWLPLIAIGGAVLAGLGIAGARAGRRRPVEPRAVARRLAAQLAERAGREAPGETARRVVEGLGEYLATARGRAPGALTPAEALAAFAPDDLGQRAAQLVEGCDRISYSGRPAETAAELAGEARSLYEVLASRGLNARRGTRRP